jgi:hypothetical protein
MKPSTRIGTNTTGSPVQTTVPSTRQGFEQPTTGSNGTSGTEPTQTKQFSPLDFLANSASFSLGIPASTLTEHEGLDQLPRPDGNSRSSVLPMELMIYNDFMTDIEGTARFFEQDFLNSILFEATPTSPLPTDDTPA